MTIALIQLVLIVVTAFLVRSARTIKSTESYIFVLVCGVITFLFEPVLAVSVGQVADGGMIQLAAEVFGVYCIIWSIVRMVKSKKVKNI